MPDSRATALRAGGVDDPEAVLPEATANRKERVVFNDGLAVGAVLSDRCAAELPRDFARVRIENALDCLDRRGLLLQQHFPGNGFDIGVRECDADREAIHHLLELRHPRQGALPRADDHYSAVELFRDGLRDLGHDGRALMRVADVLLNFVEDQQRTGHLPAS